MMICIVFGVSLVSAIELQNRFFVQKPAYRSFNKDRRSTHPTHETFASRSPTQKSGCEWFGTAPFCYQTCPSDYDFIRQHSGRCADGAACIPDASFGEPCIKLFSYQMTKKFCCKSDPIDCSWSGRWMGAEDAFNFYCRFDAGQGNCGRLECSVNHSLFKAHNSSLIEGENCDEVQMWNLRGKASCGYIAWFQNGEYRNSWYKTF